MLLFCGTDILEDPNRKPLDCTEDAFLSETFVLQAADEETRAIWIVDAAIDCFALLCFYALPSLTL